MKAIVPIACGTEELEAVTIIDVLRRVGVEVVVLSVDDEFGVDIECSRGVCIVADELWNEDAIADADIIILPGGLGGMDAFANDERVLKAVKEFASNKNKYVAAICASPVVLGIAGVLKGKKYTCYPGMEKEIQDGEYLKEDNIVMDGNIITSKGPATALAFSITLAQILAGPKATMLVAEAMLIK